MKAVVVLAHPRPGSLNHALARAAAEALTGAGFEVHFHDLYGEGFDPILHASEIETTVFEDEIAARHAAEIQAADRIVLIHPNWFFQVPAMMKGWVDRVLREGIAFHLDEHGVRGLLRAERALVLTTANSPHTYEMNVLGDPLDTFWRRCVFEPAGVARVERLVFTPVRGSTAEQRRAWLRRAAEVAAQP